ncbi:MAG: hypothetical protein ACLFPQ_03980 [Candidatus Woesearchaeota archaeon]
MAEATKDLEKIVEKPVNKNGLRRTLTRGAILTGLGIAAALSVYSNIKNNEEPVPVESEYGTQVVAEYTQDNDDYGFADIAFGLGQNAYDPIDASGATISDVIGNAFNEQTDYEFLQKDHPYTFRLYEDGNIEVVPAKYE